MDFYTRIKQDMRDELKESILEDFSDLIEIQIKCMSLYRHANYCHNKFVITFDETTTLGCTLKAVVRSISYSLYHNEMISIDDIIKLFDENIERYENSPIN